ncbi:MAG: hypothetical protein ACKO91_00985 [Acidimicrobiales bacterium]
MLRKALSAALVSTAFIVIPGSPTDASSWRSTARSERIVVIGDSVASTARREIERALRPLAGTVQIDATPCRGVTRSCTAPGVPVRPGSGLVVAGRTTADVVVVELGYNDTPTLGELRRMTGTLTARGARRVLWVTLHEGRSRYRAVNDALRTLASSDPSVALLDWRAEAAERPEWFTDKVHLSRAGVTAFSAFLARELAARR